jgi:signal transduction histidine kinase
LVYAETSAQSNNNQPIKYEWEEFPAERSDKDFEQFKEKYLDKSFYFEINERIAFMKKGYQAATQLERDTSKYFFSQFLAMTYMKVDSFTETLYYLNNCLDLSYDADVKSNAYNLLGSLYLDIGDYPTSLDYYFKSVEEAKKLNTGLETYALGNISDVYLALDDMDNAIKYTYAALPFSKSLAFPDKEYNLVFDYSRLAEYYDKKNELDSAQQYANLAIDAIKAIDTIDHPGNKEACFEAYIIISKFYLKHKLLEATKNYIIEARRFVRDYNQHKLFLVEGKYELAQKNYDAVKKIIQKLEQNQKKDLEYAEEILLLKIDYYNTTNNYKKAFEAQQELTKLQKERFNKDKIRYSAFANAEYKALEQEEEIEALRQKRKLDNLTIQNQSYIVIIAIILTILLLSGGGFLWYQNRQRKRLSSYLQEQVAIKTKHLEQANYELKTLSFIASHDIKEPIRNIGTFIGFIERKLPSNLQTSLSDYVQMIKQSASHLYTLVEDFARYTTMSNVEQIAKEPIDLNVLVNSLEAGLYETLQNTKGKIIYQDLPTINSNNSLLYSALKNLVENGLKYNQSITPQVEISYKSTEIEHLISISDNGIGIKEEYHKKIFEMFKRLHNRESFKGSGIGLSIVKLAIEKLNGTITIESEEGQGSIFVLTLPK